MTILFCFFPGYVWKVNCYISWDYEVQSPFLYLAPLQTHLSHFTQVSSFGLWYPSLYIFVLTLMILRHFFHFIYSGLQKYSSPSGSTIELHIKTYILKHDQTLILSHHCHSHIIHVHIYKYSWILKLHLCSICKIKEIHLRDLPVWHNIQYINLDSFKVQ